MKQRLLISVAAAALMAGTGFANAQGTNSQGNAGREAPSGMTQQNSSSSSERGSTTAPMQNKASESKGSKSDMKSTQSEEHMQRGSHSKSAQDNKTNQEKTKDQKSAQERAKGDHSRSTSSEADRTKDSHMKAEGREGRNGNMNAESKSPESKSQTTGQAGAGAKLSTEQRTKITTVIKEQHVQPVTNVNFSISVGARVPRSVHFHPLPADIITIYPAWRGYEFFLVRDEIIVVNPHSMEIVAVLEA